MSDVPDAINGLFELFGGVVSWFNVRRLYRDKCVRGVSIPAWAFFAVWGFWNLYYYPQLGQWASLFGTLAIVSANATWFVLAAHYTRKGQ